MRCDNTQPTDRAIQIPCYTHTSGGGVASTISTRVDLAPSVFVPQPSVLCVAPDRAYTKYVKSSCPTSARVAASTMDYRTTKTGRIWVDDEGIIHIVATGAASTADSTAETLGVVGELTAGGKAPILFDVRRWPSGDAAFWSLFVNTIESVCLAGAAVVDPQAAASLGAFPSAIDSMLVPFRVFSDDDEALAFLRTHLSG